MRRFALLAVLAPVLSTSAHAGWSRTWGGSSAPDYGSLEMTNKEGNQVA